MLALVVIGVVLVLSGITCLRYARDEQRLPLHFVSLLGGMLAVLFGVMSLYLAYLTTTDHFGR
jgi:uncharacterized membrane protein HdeD (DUF308 family)